jgi:hypothetical protein
MTEETSPVSPTKVTLGSVLAAVAGIGGILLPFLPAQYQLYAQAILAGITYAAYKLP